MFWKYSLIHHVSPFDAAIIFYFLILSTKRWILAATMHGSRMTGTKKNKTSWESGIQVAFSLYGIFFSWDKTQEKKSSPSHFHVLQWGVYIPYPFFQESHSWIPRWFDGCCSHRWFMKFPMGPYPIDHMSQVKPHNLGDQIPSGKLT